MKPLIFIFLIAAFALSFRLATPANVTGKRTKQLPKHVKLYIEEYLQTAKEEADLFNIPVSIKLAQGILESDCGRSDLAVYENNHFGIKCRKCRNKKDFALYYDDGPNNKFRVYKSAWWSYRAHSKLLCGPIYKHLLKLHRLEYRKWAHGLKKAGYATNPKYAEALISVIENYGLWVYDFKTIGNFF